MSVNSTATVNIPPPRATAKITDEKGVITFDGIRAFLLAYNANPLQTISTAHASGNFGLPLSSQNQDQEITFVKISSDSNTPTLVASGSDLINAAGAWAATSYAMGTAQGDFVKMKADGAGNWYVTGHS